MYVRTYGLAVAFGTGNPAASCLSAHSASRAEQAGCLLPVCPQCFTCRASRLPLACLPAVLHMQSKPAASCLLAFSASHAEQAGCLLPACLQCFMCRASRLPLVCLPSVLHVQSKPAASCLLAFSACRLFLCSFHDAGMSWRG